MHTSLPVRYALCMYEVAHRGALPTLRASAVRTRSERRTIAPVPMRYSSVRSSGSRCLHIRKTPICRASSRGLAPIARRFAEADCCARNRPCRVRSAVSEKRRINTVREVYLI